MSYVVENYEKKCEESAKEITRELKTTVVLNLDDSICTAEIEGFLTIYENTPCELWHNMVSFINGVDCAKQMVKSVVF